MANKNLALASQDLDGYLAYASKLNKEWGSVRLSHEIGKVRRLSFGSISADYATYGGLPYGKIVTTSGVNHSGKTLGACCMTMLTARRNNILLVINQVRVEKLPYPVGAVKYTEPCGYALDYFPSFKIRFGTRKFINEKREEISDSKAKDAVGFRISFSTTKSRVGATNRGGGYITFLYDKGMDYLGDLISTATTFGYINGGSWVTLTDPLTGEILTTKSGEPLKFNGKNKLMEFLEEHSEFTEKYADRLRTAMSGRDDISLLGDEDLSVILEQEKQLSESNSKEAKAFKEEMEKLEMEDSIS